MSLVKQVEKILDRKILKGGQVSYLVKWKNFPSDFNKWECKEELSSADWKHIEEFEIEYNNIKKNISVNISSSTMTHLKNQASTNPEMKNKEISKVLSNEKQNQINKDLIIDNILKPKRSLDLIGCPDELLKIETVNHKLYFLVKWKESYLTSSLVPYHSIRENYPYILLDFYERRLRLGKDAVAINSKQSDYNILTSNTDNKKTDKNENKIDDLIKID